MKGQFRCLGLSCFALSVTEGALNNSYLREIIPLAVSESEVLGVGALVSNSLLLWVLQVSL